MAIQTAVKAKTTKAGKTAAPEKVQLNSAKGAQVQQISNARGDTFQVLNFEPTKDRFGVSLGVRKIKLVLEHLAEAEVFVNSGGMHTK